tara:strand:+ start:494 stop:745 length:252 start_codon:yes stop_codon:yes gene_type:complete
MENEYIIIECPHCKDYITVYLKDYNCKIFRHGIYKDTLKQIDPHLKKPECDRLFNEKKIYGCGKPFQIVGDGKEINVEICNYI